MESTTGFHHGVKTKPVTLESLRKQKAELEAKDNKFDIATAWKDMESIPLGTLGAKLMIIFGDGPRPDHKLVLLPFYLLESVYKVQSKMHVLYEGN